MHEGRRWREVNSPADTLPAIACAILLTVGERLHREITPTGSLSSPPIPRSQTTDPRANPITHEQTTTNQTEFSKMKNPQKNQQIRVTRPGRGYTPSKIYTIVRVDPSDNTLIAMDSNGQEGSWIKWDHCVIAGPDIGWDWLKGQLPGEILEFLSAFHGLENLRLKPEVRDFILLQIPNLKERILQAQIAIEEQYGTTEFGEAPTACPAPDDEEECPV